jgi:uncharacterized protein involved in type VI secretion and phage assembly
MADSPILNSEGVARLTLQSNGKSIDSAEIVSVKVKRSTNAVPSAQIVLLDGDVGTGDWPSSDGENFALGAEIAILAGYGDVQEAVFSGIVVKAGVRVAGDNDSRLIVECRDEAVCMTLGRNNANYIDMSDSDIIGKLLGKHGLASDVASTEATHKTLVQYGCTDWDFMIARAELNGLLVTFVDGKVAVKPPETSAEPVLAVTYGIDLIDFHAEMTSLNQQGNLDRSKLGKVAGPEKLEQPLPSPLDAGTLKTFGEAHQLKAGLTRIRGHLRFQGSAKALPGTLIDLKGLGKRYDGKVFVGAVEHEITNGDWLTKVEFGLAPHWITERPDVATPGAGGWLPAIHGLQVGKVLKLDGDPIGEHRVQIELPLLEAEIPGIWARLTQFHASNAFGAMFVPEVGDEVVVAYLGDDPSVPIVIGSLYSSQRPPPYALEAENKVKAVVTRCKARIEINDEDKVITIKTPGNNTVVLSDKDQMIKVTDQSSNEVKLSPDGIMLSSPKDISISANGSIKVDAVGAISIQSQADVSTKGLNVSCKADVGFSAEGSASAQLSASGQTVVKGALVMIN